jgi:hypothetical protein
MHAVTANCRSCFAIPLGKLKLKLKKQGLGLKFCVPSTILKLIRAYTHLANIRPI